MYSFSLNMVIRVIEEFENTRVRVLPYGQFRQPIQRPCNTPIALQSSRSLTEATVGTPYRQQLFPARFFNDLHFDIRAHQQECLQSALQWKPCRKIPLHTSISSPTLKFTCMATSEALFGHAPPPTMLYVVDEPLQPPAVSRCRRKTPHFPLFLSGDCF